MPNMGGNVPPCCVSGQLYIGILPPPGRIAPPHWWHCTTDLVILYHHIGGSVPPHEWY